MILKRLFQFILILVATNSFSQNGDFKYHTELCECNAKFDTTICTRKELQNTIDLLWWAPSIDYSSTVWTLEEIEQLNVQDLRTECEAKINKIRTAKFVNHPFWNQLLAERIRFYESTCRLKEFTIQAYSNPKILLEYDLVDSTCIYYRNALIAGGEQLIDAWFTLHEDQKKNNGSPENLQRRFDEKYHSDKRLEYARLEVMTFGWWNNANHQLPHINAHYIYEDEFEKLFVEVKCECDEP